MDRVDFIEKMRSISKSTLTMSTESLRPKFSCNKTKGTAFKCIAELDEVTIYFGNEDSNKDNSASIIVGYALIFFRGTTMYITADGYETSLTMEFPIYDVEELTGEAYENLV